MDNSASSYLVVFLLAFVVLASGCASNQTPDQNSPVNNTDSTENNPSEDTSTSSGSAEISLTSLNVPDEVEMGSEFTVEATFENTGGASGEFETTVMVKESGGQSFSATDNKIQGEVPAGEERTYEATLDANGVSTNIISLAGTDSTQEIRIVPKKVEVGEQYTTSNDIGITVQSLELADYYTYEDYMGEETIQEPESGQQYVFINLKTQNKASTPQSLPTSYDFQLIANNRQYEGSTVLYNEPVDKGQAYEGGEVQPSIIREGYIVFTVPSDVDKQDISVVWNEMISLTEKSVYWTS